MTLGIVLAYLCLLVALGAFSGRLLRKTSGDYFIASRGIGPFMLLMSVFGTTMTAFALIGSTGETFESGIGVYGLMASWSGIVHALVFFLVGARVWALGKKHGYLTQISYFRDRYRSKFVVPLLLFFVVVHFVLIYILMGVVGSGRFLENITVGTWERRGVITEVPLEVPADGVKVPPDLADRLRFDAEAGKLVLDGSIHARYKPALLQANPSLAREKSFQSSIAELFTKAPNGALPRALGMALICLVVLFYVFFGGMRATAWANTFQTLVFMIMGVVAFVVITKALGGAQAATENLLKHPEGATRMAREGLIGKWQFATYCFIPLSVGMFPHLFQHWLTAKKASNFKLTVVAHPLCILITWLPCVLLGMWAAGVLPLESTLPNSVLGIMVSRYSGDFLTGLIGAGVLAAIMSSMDSQFLCLSSIFTNDVVAPYLPYVTHRELSDRAKIVLGRAFVICVVAVSYLVAYFNPANVFDLGVWCFTGFAGLFPILIAALYWPRSNKYGVIASILSVKAIWLIFLPRVLRGGEVLVFDIEIMPVALIVVVSTVVLVAVTLLTPPPPRDVVEKFFPQKAES